MTITARIATMARTHTTSMSVNPASAGSPSLCPAGDIGCCTGAAFLSIRAIGQDVVRSVLARRAIKVWPSPWVFGNDVAFQIRSVPAGYAARALHQRPETIGV